MTAYKYLIYFFSFGLAILFFVPNSAYAGTLDNVSGWAWSSNIGWISFNATNTASTVDYGVDENVDGTLTGYAWSSNIGWIKFGGLLTSPSTFPSGTDTRDSDAKVDGNNVVGWARACAGTATGNCSTTASRADGWDGWISLSGKTTDGKTYGVSVNNGNFYGYAWGGDVVGWIDFNPYVAGQGTPDVGCNGPNNCSVTTTSTPPPSGFTLSCPNLHPNQAGTLSINPSEFSGSGTLSITSPLSGLPAGTSATYSFYGSYGPQYYYPFGDENLSGYFNCYHSSGGTYSCDSFNLGVAFDPPLAFGQTYSGSFTVRADDNDTSNPVPSETCTVEVTSQSQSQNTGPTHYQEF